MKLRKRILCIYVCMYVCTYVCMSCMRVCMYVWMCWAILWSKTDMYVCMYACVEPFCCSGLSNKLHKTTLIGTKGDTILTNVNCILHLTARSKTNVSANQECINFFDDTVLQSKRDNHQSHRKVELLTKNGSFCYTYQPLSSNEILQFAQKSCSLLDEDLDPSLSFGN
jgi:hypothetical protein